LQHAILRLQAGLGPEIWGKTMLLAMTEFGRTARENGTAGTDQLSNMIDALATAANVVILPAALRTRRAGVLAECGGNLSCATCHVYIDEASFDRVGPAEAGSLEDEMLDNVSSDRLPSSRLSCQVHVVAEMDGVTVRVAPQQT